MDGLSAVDVAVAVILGVAVLRGLWIGLVREAFSIAALAGALVAVRLFTAPVASWLRHEAGLEAGDLALRVAAGALVAVTVVLAVAAAGRLLRRGLRAAGLGWADRLGGGLLGGAEGLLVAGVLLWAVVALLGRDHAQLAGSRAVAALDEARRVAAPDVAAPPP
jgi:membrane protein required for colicin V production